jgi:hypothetical protein
MTERELRNPGLDVNIAASSAGQFGTLNWMREAKWMPRAGRVRPNAGSSTHHDGDHLIFSKFAIFKTGQQATEVATNCCP